jgi:hypothetical protein
MKLLSARNNPLFAQQVESSRFPSLRITLLGGVVAAPLLLVLEAALFALFFQYRPGILRFVLFKSQDAFPMIPVFLMPILSSMAARRIWQSRLDGVEGAPMTAQQTITGLILSVFYQLRVLVVLMLVTIPVIVFVSGASVAVLFNMFFRPQDPFGWRMVVNALLSQGEVAAFLFQMAALFIIGGVIGTVLAVTIARPWVSAGSAFLITIVLWPVYLSVTRTVPRLSTGWASGVGLNVLLAGVLGLLLLIPFAIAWIASRAARRWVQPST